MRRGPFLINDTQGDFGAARPAYLPVNADGTPGHSTARAGPKWSYTGNASHALLSSPGTSGPPSVPPIRSTATPPRPTTFRSKPPDASNTSCSQNMGDTTAEPMNRGLID